MGRCELERGYEIFESESVRDERLHVDLAGKHERYRSGIRVPLSIDALHVEFTLDHDFDRKVEGRFLRPLNDVDIAYVARLLGHESLETTK